MVTSFGLPGSASRPWTAVSRSWNVVSPSMLPMKRIAWLRAGLGRPFLPRGATGTSTAVRTAFTPGARDSAAVIGATLPPLGAYTEALRSEGLVPARKIGYDDWVRRAAAIDPI